MFKFFSNDGFRDGEMTLYFNDQRLMHITVKLVDDYADMMVRDANDSPLAFWIEDLKEKQDV